MAYLDERRRAHSLSQAEGKSAISNLSLDFHWTGKARTNTPRQLDRSEGPRVIDDLSLELAVVVRRRSLG